MYIVHTQRTHRHQTIISKCMLNTTWHLKFLKLKHTVFEHSPHSCALPFFMFSGKFSQNITTTTTTNQREKKSIHCALCIVYTLVHLDCETLSLLNAIFAIYHSSFPFEIRARELKKLFLTSSLLAPRSQSGSHQLQYTNFSRRDT